MKKLIYPLLICALVWLAACGQNKPQQALKAELNQPAPDFNLVDTNGKTWKLSDLRGQVVFINFWATWCPPCRSEMPAMQELYTSMPADKFKMLAILVNDEPSTADRVAAKSGCTFPILVDPENKTVKKYKVIGIPQTFIVDKKGVLRKKFIGPAEWNSPDVKGIIEKYVEM